MMMMIIKNNCNFLFILSTNDSFRQDDPASTNAIRRRLSAARWQIIGGGGAVARRPQKAAATHAAARPAQTSKSTAMTLTKINRKSFEPGLKERRSDGWWEWTERQWWIGIFEMRWLWRRLINSTRLSMLPKWVWKLISQAGRCISTWRTSRDVKAIDTCFNHAQAVCPSSNQQPCPLYNSIKWWRGWWW